MTVFWHQLAVMRALCSTVGASFSKPRELSMKKVILVGFAILAVSTSGALAKKAEAESSCRAATTANTGGPAPFMQASAKDLELYKKNQRDSGIKEVEGQTAPCFARDRSPDIAQAGRAKKVRPPQLAAFSMQTDRPPAGVKRTKVPLSYIASQPRSIAKFMPAPYSAVLLRLGRVRDLQQLSGDQALRRWQRLKLSI